MRKTRLLLGVLLLLGSFAACATEPKQCNYGYPTAVFNDDLYSCQMEAESKRMSSNDRNMHHRMGAQWVSDCMARLGWTNCRK